MSELRRRIGEVRSTEIVAAMAMDLTSTVPTTLTTFLVLYLSLSLQVKRRCLSLFCERLLNSAVNISVSRFEKNGFNGF